MLQSVGLQRVGHDLKLNRTITTLKNACYVVKHMTSI